MNLCMIGTLKAQECVPSENSCQYYLCLENKMQCGYNGYPLKLGYRFCNNILRVKTKSADLQDWFKKTRSCLQEKMSQKQDLRCSQLAHASVKDHVGCYIDNGYCELSKSKQRFIKKLVIKKFYQAPKFIFMNAKALLKKGCKK